MAAKPLAQAPLQLPCSVVILSVAAEGGQGAMTATAMYVSEKPPLVAVSVSRTFATHQLIEKTGEFVINVLADDQLDLARKFGKVHGFEVDKFKEFGIATEGATTIKGILIPGCFSNVECRVKTSVWEVGGNHAIYIAEPVAFRVNDKLKPVVWLTGKYFRVGTECRL